jgi:hypothetical protein
VGLWSNARVASFLIACSSVLLGSLGSASLLLVADRKPIPGPNLHIFGKFVRIEESGRNFMLTVHVAVAAIALMLRSPGDGLEGVAGIPSIEIGVPAIALSGRSVEKVYWDVRYNSRRYWIGSRRPWNGGPPVWVGGCWRWRATHWGIGQAWSCW